MFSYFSNRLRFHLELVKGKDGWFGDAYDMAWEKEITVVRAR